MYEYKARLDRVVDGDTVDCVISLGFAIHFKTRVRLLGINAPESRTRNKEEKKRGLAAKQWLIDQLEKAGNEFTIKTTLDKKGKYGRVLGVLTVETEGGWIDLNDYMVLEGHAVKYDGGKR